MKVPVNWLRELTGLDQPTAQIAQGLTRAGLNVEKIESSADVVSGRDLVVGRVLEMHPEPQKNGKTINWCRVEVGEQHMHDADERNNQTGTDGTPVPGRGIICGAQNFGVGDLVVVALPGAVLPGGFEIASRKTYGHISDGMICAIDEIGLGTDHEGIIVLDPATGARPGDDALSVLGARDEVLELDITPDLGYCLSLRGAGREACQAMGAWFTDPYAPAPGGEGDQVGAVEQHVGYPVRLESQACTRFVAFTIEGLDPSAPTPQWMQTRLQQAGMRSVSVLVDITNYVMLESGQPLHAYDADRLQGPIVVRQAAAGETLQTLDGQERGLTGDELVIADDSGVIGLAGLMGGRTTEVGDSTTRVVLEAANFDAITVGRAMRHHKLFSEASKRFEKGVDPVLPDAAAARAAQLMAELAAGTVSSAVTRVGQPPSAQTQQLSADLPNRVLGLDLSDEQVGAVFAASGITASLDAGKWSVRPPSWRLDLVDPYDYVEEVGRKIGLDSIALVPAPVGPGTGLTAEQRGRRQVLAAAAASGFTEQMLLPFIAADQVERLGIELDDLDDHRAALVRLANPLDETQPYLRSTLLPGLFAAVARNTSRSNDDLALFELARVFRGRDLPAAPRLGVEQRPSDAELAASQAALPDQPRMLAAVVCGMWRPDGWQGAGERAGWQHVALLAQNVGQAVGVRLEREQAQCAPWHPGRCAALLADGQVIGYVGELHPQVVKAFGLPDGTAALELDTDALLAAMPGIGTIAPLYSAPVAKEDVALVVDERVPAAAVEAALVLGAGDLLESVHLFDVYRSEQLGAGKKSLAFALRFRGETTLKDDQAAQARDAAVKVAAEQFGAVLRGA